MQSSLHRDAKSLTANSELDDCQSSNNLKLVSLKEASEWASRILAKNVAKSNISYLVQYGKIKKHTGTRNTALVDLNELKRYYDDFYQSKQNLYEAKLGRDLDWNLAFDRLTEKETTKHVHRMHPYKGKFIPQLVEWFLGREPFKKGDIILDPFMGSGTTLVQANEMHMHSIGIDVSKFNCLIAQTKLADYDLPYLENTVRKLKQELSRHAVGNIYYDFKRQVDEELRKHNDRYMPKPQRRALADNDDHTKKMESVFVKKYGEICKNYGITPQSKNGGGFLDKWYTASIRNEISLLHKMIEKIPRINEKNIMRIILSRTIRTGRATTHYDLTTLKNPQHKPYYCRKHMKMCTPIFSISRAWNRYCSDTIERLREFKKLKTAAAYGIIHGNAESVDILKSLRNSPVHSLLKQQKIQGIFTSPPYVGQIDYHEQHAYSYELLGMKRYDELEIGAMRRGKSAKARQDYSDKISAVLSNCKKHLADDFDIFIVANDVFDLYPDIIARAGMRIERRTKRPVLNRTERDKSPYAEFIFHVKSK